MLKILNIFMFLVVIFFVFFIYNYYSSNKNMGLKSYNRSNIDEILKEKIKDLPILANDTNNVIAFNDTFEEEIDEDKKRSFWELLKDK